MDNTPLSVLCVGNIYKSVLEEMQASIVLTIILYALSVYILDIDECAESSVVCEQVCTDTDGSFQCSCRNGFRLGSNGRSCDGE